MGLLPILTVVGNYLLYKPTLKKTSGTTTVCEKKILSIISNITKYLKLISFKIQLLAVELVTFYLCAIWLLCQVPCSISLK